MFDTEYERELRDKIKLLDKMLDDREILRTAYEIQRLETAKYKAYFFGYKEIIIQVIHNIYFADYQLNCTEDC